MKYIPIQHILLEIISQQLPISSKLYSFIRAVVTKENRNNSLFSTIYVCLVDKISDEKESLDGLELV